MPKGLLKTAPDKLPQTAHNVLLHYVCDNTLAMTAIDRIQHP